MLLRLATRSESCDRARTELKKLALALVHAWVVMFADSVPCGTRDLHESRSRRGPAAMRQVDKAEAQQIRPRARCFRNPTHVKIITWIGMCAAQLPWKPSLAVAAGSCWLQLRLAAGRSRGLQLRVLTRAE